MKSLPELSLAVLLALSATVASNYAQDSSGTSGGSITINSGAIFINGYTGLTSVNMNGGTLQNGLSNSILDSGGNQVIVVKVGTIATTTDGTLTLTNSGQTNGGFLLQSYIPIIGDGTLTLDTETGFGLVKSGGGTLIFGTGNTFTGGTIIGTTSILNASTGLNLSTGVGNIIATGGNLTLGNATTDITYVSNISNGTITGLGLQQSNTLTINPFISATALGTIGAGNIGTANSQLAPIGLPEPSVAALLACGVALGLRRQRKR